MAQSDHTTSSPLGPLLPGITTTRSRSSPSTRRSGSRSDQPRGHRRRRRHPRPRAAWPSQASPPRSPSGAGHPAAAAGCGQSRSRSRPGRGHGRERAQREHPANPSDRVPRRPRGSGPAPHRGEPFEQETRRSGSANRAPQQVSAHRWPHGRERDAPRDCRYRPAAWRPARSVLCEAFIGPPQRPQRAIPDIIVFAGRPGEVRRAGSSRMPAPAATAPQERCAAHRRPRRPRRPGGRPDRRYEGSPAPSACVAGVQLPPRRVGSPDAVNNRVAAISEPPSATSW